MQLFKVLMRIAVICNICFMTALLLLRFPSPPQGPLVSTVIVMGCLMGLPVNAVVLTWSLSLHFAGRWRSAALPVWLPAFNFVIFCLQSISLIHQLR